MATGKRAKKRNTRSSAPAETPLLFHRIQALLHTMRCIVQYEDELCTFLHASRSRDIADSTMEEELRSLLESMPAQEYSHDLESVRAALPATLKGFSKARTARAGAKSASYKRSIAKKPVAKKARPRAASKKAVATKSARRKTSANKAKRTTRAAKKAVRSAGPRRSKK